MYICPLQPYFTVHSPYVCVCCVCQTLFFKPDVHHPHPVSYNDTKGQRESGTEIQTAALNIYMSMSMFTCVSMVCLSRHVNIYSVNLVTV